MPPMRGRGAKRRRMAAAEKKAAAAAMAAAAVGAPLGDWWDAFCRRMSGASLPSPSASALAVCRWRWPVAVRLSPLGFVADCAIGRLCRVREELRR